MFAVLEIEEEKRGYKERLKNMFLLQKPQIEKVQIKDDLSFYLIKAKKRKGNIDWRKIEKVAGRCRKRMLVPEHISIPKDSSVERFVPQQFQRVLLYNTAVSLLQKTFLEPSRVIISVIDYYAEDFESIYLLLPYASIIKIITKRVSEYEDFAEKLFMEFGIRLIITDDEAAAKNSTLILATEKVVSEDLKRCRVLSLNTQKSFKHLLSIGCVELPKDYVIPQFDGISSFDFVSAIYELCSQKSIGYVAARTLMLKGREISLILAAELIRDNNML